MGNAAAGRPERCGVAELAPSAPRVRPQDERGRRRAGIGGHGARCRWPDASEIYADQRQLADYDEDRSWRVFASVLAEQWTTITVAAAADADRPGDLRSSVCVRLLRRGCRRSGGQPGVGTVKTVDGCRSAAERFSPVDPATVIN